LTTTEIKTFAMSYYILKAKLDAMNSKVFEEITKLKNDYVHGASWLSLHAINTLILAASESQVATVSEFIQEIKEVAQELTSARPSITPITNYANQFLHQIIMMSQNENNVEALKSFAEAKGKELVKSATKAVSKAVEYACGIISDLDTIVTCSYSSTVCQVLELARQRETRFRVIAAESKYNDKAYGEITAEQLMKYQIPVEIVPDAKINLSISKADKALVGADSITADGYLINGKPTLPLAQAAKIKKIPFYVVCESAKFTIPCHLIKPTELEPSFDKTPLDLVTGIITEKGTMQPNLVIAYIEEKAEGMAHPFTSKGE
jgi:translation initiation factor 2B subunit (eIF-2B alpha/beta/delta family)